MRTPAPTLTRRAAIGAGVAGLSALHAAPLLARAQGATPAAAPATPGVTPDTVAQALDALDDLVADAMDRTGVPGVAVGVVFDGEIATTRGYGVTSTDTGDPVDADTVFQIASLSKSLASTVVASIVGDGAVTWDTPVADHLPGFALHDPWITRAVTIRDMFAHRSGLPDHGGDLLEDLGYDRDTILRRLHHLPPEYPFRAGYAYTNFGLTAGAVAAANATGVTWEDAADLRLYDPAGMTRTSSRFADFEAADNRAHGHVRDGDSWVPRYVRQPDPESPAGGVSSTATDMARWVALQLAGGALDGEQLIDPDALAETHRPQVISVPPDDPVTDTPQFYGLGWNVTPGPAGTQLGHSGAFALGTGTAVQLLPADGIGIVVLTNAMPVGVAEAIVYAFMDLARGIAIRADYVTVFGEILGGLLQPQYGQAVAGDPPADPEPPQAADAYTGIYDNPYFGSIEIAAADGGLSIALGPRPDVYELPHWNRDTFTYFPIGENQNARSAVTFSLAPDGTASHVRIENLDTHGLGTFTRAPAEA